MGKETDAFLNNECMEAIRELAKKHPNDMSLGEAVRSFLLSNKLNKATNQLSIGFEDGPEPNMGDVNEY